MELFNHHFVNAHIIGCSPVKKIEITADKEMYYYQFELYTTGGLHKFNSETYNSASFDFYEEADNLKSHNDLVNTWKEVAERYINFIESLNPSNYDLP